MFSTSPENILFYVDNVCMKLSKTNNLFYQSVIRDGITPWFGNSPVAPKSVIAFDSDCNETDIRLTNIK